MNTVTFGNKVIIRMGVKLYTVYGADLDRLQFNSERHT